MFPPTSRYAAVEVAQLQVGDRAVPYLRRRFVPAPDGFVLLREHVVVAGDRLDNVTATYLTDPLQFWRVADANGAMRPEELVETIGLRLRITPPQGLPGIPMGVPGAPDG